MPEKSDLTIFKHNRKSFKEALDEDWKLGWKKLKEIHEKNQTDDLLMSSQLTLTYLGAVRKLLVDRLFKKCNKFTIPEKNSILVLGSTNITSDYDATIVGPDAPYILECMFKTFYKKHNNILPFAMDTNLYCNGIYYYDPTYPTLQMLIKMDEARQIKNNFILKPTESTQLIFLCFSLLRLLPFLKKNSVGFDPKIIKMVDQLNKKLNNLFTMEKLKLSKKRIKNTEKNFQDSEEILDTLVKYKLKIKLSKEIYGMLFSPNISTISPNIFQKVCMAQYYSMESYFTPSTVMIVVLGIQGKIPLPKLTMVEIFCCVFENIGEIYDHLGNKIYPWKKFLTVIKNLSKYIYRVFYALTLLNPQYKAFSNSIHQNIVKKRGATFSPEDEKNIVELLIPPKLVGKKISTKEYMNEIYTPILAELAEYVNQLL
jgi:hypothetical protein